MNKRNITRGAYERVRVTLHIGNLELNMESVLPSTQHKQMHPNLTSGRQAGT